jgi:hypothetical protein
MFSLQFQIELNSIELNHFEFNQIMNIQLWKGTC